MTWRLGLASLSLMAAVAVYLFLRMNPPALLEPFQVANALAGAQTDLFGSAPSLLYTLSIGLLIGTCISTQSSARLHCLLWIALALILEISQAAVFATSIVAWLAEILPDSVWELVRPYWARGVFDWLDLLAVSIGGAIALAVLTYLPREKSRETEY